MKSFYELCEILEETAPLPAQKAMITGTKDGKTVTVEVELQKNCDSLYYVRKPGGKPFFGTTGYYHPLKKSISKYRGEIIMTDVEVRWL